MSEQLAIQQFLTSHLHEVRRRNTSYSVRALSRRLGMNSGAVSSILRGQRRVSKKMAIRILDRMAAHPKVRAGILSQFDALGPDSRGENENAVQLSIDQFDLISRSVHFEVLCLMETSDFRNDLAWMAGRLKRTTREIQEAIDRLIRIGMITRTSRNELLLLPGSLQSPDNIPSGSIRQSHFESLQQANESLVEDPIEVRDFTSNTFAIDPEMLPAAQKIIRDCRRKLERLFQAGDKREVYKLAIQLFPVSELREVK